jgi:hypothetical protein
MNYSISSMSSETEREKIREETHELETTVGISFDVTSHGAFA